MTIRVKLTGGLGNQMFQFSAGYSIAKKITWVYNWKKHTQGRMLFSIVHILSKQKTIKITGMCKVLEIYSIMKFVTFKSDK